MFDPGNPDEVVVTEPLAREAPIGTVAHLHANGPDQVNGGPPDGPATTLRVVGIVRTVNQFLLTPGQIFLSPAYLARYGDRVLQVENADVRLRHPAADVATLQREVNADIGRGTPLLDLHAVSRRVDTTLDVEKWGLLVLGVVAAIAGGLLVAQVMARSASGI